MNRAAEIRCPYWLQVPQSLTDGRIPLGIQSVKQTLIRIGLVAHNHLHNIGAESADNHFYYLGESATTLHT